VEQRGRKSEQQHAGKNNSITPRYVSWGKEIKITIPNTLTLIRMALTPFISISIFYKHTILACILFCIAALTDALDGLIARMFKQETLLGKLLDPIADKILLNTVNIILSFGSIFTLITIPGWLTLVIISRDLLIIASGSLIVVVANYTDIYPSWSGKLSTICQFISIMGVLIANLSENASVVIALQMFFYITFFFTVFSGILYLFQVAHIINRIDKSPQE
jgi:cardiolipin synthase (CMP-forming)